MKQRPLDPAALQAALTTLPSWRIDNAKLYRELRLPDFVTAFALMTRVALVAERLNHHPEWFNCYGTLRVWLTTHDAGGITELDLELARALGA
jgi:4a-hydroxytetrahydrobiopterin dehydratase